MCHLEGHAVDLSEMPTDVELVVEALDLIMAKLTDMVEGSSACPAHNGLPTSMLAMLPALRACLWARTSEGEPRYELRPKDRDGRA